MNSYLIVQIMFFGHFFWGVLLSTAGSVTTSSDSAEVIDPQTLYPYTYFFNGKDWLTKYPGCGGGAQSPIRIDSNTADPNYGNLRFILNLRSNPAIISYLHMTDITTKGNFGTLTILNMDGTKSTFINTNFSVHSPAEHNINGVQGDVELQLTFVNSNPKEFLKPIVVIAMIFNVGIEKSSFFNNWKLENIERNVATAFVMSDAFSNEFLKNTGYFSYIGSLTIPPCTGKTAWIVLDTIQSISGAQLDLIRKYIYGNYYISGGKGNNRVIQKINSRTVTYNRFTGTNLGNPINIVDQAFSAIINMFFVFALTFATLI